MKVWVLAKNSVIGVYSSLERAEAVRDERRNPYDTIEERDLDERMDWRYGPLFRFEIDRLEGPSRTYTDRSSDEWRHPERPVVEIGGPVPYEDDRHWLQVASPISPEHAEQVAREQHKEWLRSRATATR